MKRLLVIWALILIGLMTLPANASHNAWSHDRTVKKVLASSGSGMTEPAFPSFGGLTLHLDANDLVGVVSDGGTIGTWSDNSSNGWDFTQSTEANKPIFREEDSDFNNWPAVDFVSSDTLTNSSCDPIGLYTATDGWHSVVVHIETVGADTGSPWTNDTIFDAGTARTGIFAYTGVAEVFNYDGTNDKTTSAVSLNTTYLITWRHTAGNLGIAINDGAFSEIASGNTQATASCSIGDNGLDARMGEQVAHDNWDATEYTNWKTYANEKFAIW